MPINTLDITMSFKTLNVLLITIALIFSLTACDSSQDSKVSIAPQKTLKYSSDATITGKVSNKKGKIKTGIITATDNKSVIVSSTELTQTGKYSLTIPSGTELPIVLTFQKDKHTASKDKLISIVIYTSIKKYDINELTTLIAKEAKKLGGYNHRNMSLAADSTVGIPDANKTSTGFRGDPTTQYGGWH